jgi:hypothetical protein
LALLLVIAAAVFIVLAWGQPNARRHAVAASDHFWGHFYVRGAEWESYQQLSELALASDTIVIGHIASVRQGRTYGSAASGYVHYAVLVVETHEVLATNVELADSLTLELMLGENSSFDEVSASLPPETTIFFLRNKAIEAAMLGMPASAQAEERQYFRLVMRESVFRNIGDHVRVAVGAEKAFVLDWRDRPFGDFIEAVRDVLSNSTN